MQRKKAAVRFAAIILTLTFIISFPLSVSSDEAPSYNDALKAFREDMVDPSHIDTVDSAYLYCLSTDTELLSFDSSFDSPEFPADTAKLLTALTAYDMIDDLSDTVTITQKMIDNSPGTRYDYKRGDVVTYSDLLCTMLMRTANDSATALAYSLCGDMTKFSEKMNEKAASLGLKNSFFTNSTGAYDERMYTTAKDIYIIAKEFYENELFMSFVSKRWRYLDSGKMVFSNNFLVSEYYNTGKDIRDYSVNGMIVGNSQEGGVIVRSANYNGYEYICVVLGAKKDSYFTYSYEVSGELIRWGSKSFSFVKLLDKNEPITTLPVKNARENDTVPVVPTEDLSKYILSDAKKTGKLTTSINISENDLRAPIEKGTQVGSVSLYYDGKEIAECPLVTACEINENTTSSMIQTVWTAISSKSAINVYIVSLFAVTAYVLINSVVRHRRKIKRDSGGIK